VSAERPSAVGASKPEPHPEARIRDSFWHSKNEDGTCSARCPGCVASLDLDVLVGRLEQAERERDEREAGAQWQYEMGKGWRERALKAEKALRLIADGAESNPPYEVARLAREALGVPPPEGPGS
jgi:hypothetical protein